MEKIEIHNTHPQTRPVRALLRRFVKDGFTMFAVDDGGEIIKTPSVETALDNILGVDESTLYMKKDGKRFFVYFILGNDDCEIAADHSDNPDIDAIVSKFYSDYSN